ncbi:hypothetical protein BC830DRAFT_1116419 [Chytriomyces sp. MP71]|nr:hypothetical protein BC830DRAFT_1116419 [Chytriomyces sp. MP71]
MASGPSPPRTALPFEPGSLTPASFLPLFAAFLHAFHAQTHHQTAEGHAIEVKCKVQDHLVRLEQPPMFEGRTFSTYEFLSIVRDQGGFGNIRSWTDLCRKLGLNPSKSNISTRIRDWADKVNLPVGCKYIVSNLRTHHQSLAPHNSFLRLHSRLSKPLFPRASR